MVVVVSMESLMNLIALSKGPSNICRFLSLAHMVKAT